MSTDDWDDIPFREEQLQGGMTYLSDSAETIISTYGLQDATLGKAVARPASFIIDREGVIAWRYLPHDWRIRAGPDVYMNALGRLMRGELSP